MTRAFTRYLGISPVNCGVERTAQHLLRSGREDRGDADNLVGFSGQRSRWCATAKIGLNGGHPLGERNDAPEDLHQAADTSMRNNNGVEFPSRRESFSTQAIRSLPN